MKKQLKKITIAIIILILIAINLSIFISNIQPKEEKPSENKDFSSYNITKFVEEQKDEQIDIEMDNVIEEKIAKLDEGDRIKSYFGRFLEAIEDKEYQVAYSYLNEDYKNNFFPDLQSFIEYMDKTYPTKKIAVKYNSIMRKGEVFLLSVSITDGLDKSFQEKVQSVVIRENGYNDFKISFSKYERKEN